MLNIIQIYKKVFLKYSVVTELDKFELREMGTGGCIVTVTVIKDIGNNCPLYLHWIFVFRVLFDNIGFPRMRWICKFCTYATTNHSRILEHYQSIHGLVTMEED